MYKLTAVNNNNIIKTILFFTTVHFSINSKYFSPSSRRIIIYSCGLINSLQKKFKPLTHCSYTLNIFLRRQASRIGNMKWKCVLGNCELYPCYYLWLTIPQKVSLVWIKMAKSNWDRYILSRQKLSDFLWISTCDPKNVEPSTLPLW